MVSWGEYVPVAQRQAAAIRKMNQLRKKGHQIDPVEGCGRTIAVTPWGKRWCRHIENFSDYENRLPRGRTYVRSGSICHLGIEPGVVSAYVSGSSVYSVDIRIESLPAARWSRIQEQTRGEVSTLLELLKGRVSDRVMDVVADDREGLFPRSGEMRFSCSCPDWSAMCKHIASVLYGIGNRLDDRPELLFLLRGVDPADLVTSDLNTEVEESGAILEGAELSSLFGIEMEEEVDFPSGMTWEQVESIQRRLGMDDFAFTDLIEAQGNELNRWRRSSGRLSMSSRTADILSRLLGAIDLIAG